MIRFFRTLRQRLLAENRVSRYLLYAVGEVLLVVIGILLALQVNTWNEGRKFKSSQIDFLEGLRTQLINDTLFFSNQSNFSTRFNDQTEKALYLLENREHISDSSEQQTIALALGNASIMMPRTTNIIYSESAIEKIDPELNMKLVEYIQDTRHSYNVFLKLSESLQAMVDNRILPHVDLNASASTLTSRVVRYEFNSIKNNRELKNVLNASIIYRRGLIVDSQNQIEKAQKIMDLIDRLLIPFYSEQNGEPKPKS